MKASELIKELKKVMMIQGDIDVKYFNYITYGDVDIKKVSVKYINLDKKYIKIE